MKELLDRINIERNLISGPMQPRFLQRQYCAIDSAAQLYSLLMLLAEACSTIELSIGLAPA